MVNTSGASGRIAVDAMGGDLGPAEVVAAVKLALHQYPALNPITLVGHEAELNPLIALAGLAQEQRLSVFHASEVVTMDDKPLNALKKKKDSSMVRAIELVKNREAGVVVSCGNTGALMAGGTLRLRTMEGVARPALAAICPRQGGHFVLIDAGANPEAKAEHLVHNAIMGSHYCRVMLGIKSPRVGLMTIGTEEGKGNALITETHDLLRRVGDVVNYAGPIEGFHVFAEHVDVVVCDGFVGNIMLKTVEATAKAVSKWLKAEIKGNPLRLCGAMLAKGAFKALKEKGSYETYGGSPLLGVNGVVIIAHGSSSALAIRNAVRVAMETFSVKVNTRIEEAMANLATKEAAVE